MTEPLRGLFRRGGGGTQRQESEGGNGVVSKCSGNWLNWHEQLLEQQMSYDTSSRLQTDESTLTDLESHQALLDGILNQEVSLKSKGPPAG